MHPGSKGLRPASGWVRRTCTLQVKVGVATSQVPGRIFPGPNPAMCAPFFTAPLGSFLDLQNELPITTGPLVPGFGSLFASDMVMNLNNL